MLDRGARLRIGAVVRAGRRRSVAAVADVFDALSSNRPYKPSFPIDKCFAILRAESGSHFDPTIIEAFFQQRDQIVQTQLELADTE